MKTISVKVVNRVATLVASHQIFSGDSGVDSVSFSLDEEWSSFSTKKAFFSRNGKDCYFVECSGSTPTATIPSAVLDEEGILYFGLLGESGSNKISTNVIPYKIGLGASPNDLMSADGIKSLLEHIDALKGVSSMVFKFAASASGTVAPADSQFAADQYTVSDSKPYLWSTITTVYTNGTKQNVGPFVIGRLGRGISAITGKFARGNSKTSSPASSSFAADPVSTTPSEPYLWIIIKVLYTTGESNEIGPFICGTFGDRGEKGDKGDQGIPGQDSPDIELIRTWIDERIAESTSVPFDSGYQDDEGFVHLTNGGEDIEGFIPFKIAGGGGGGGGGSSNPAEMTMTNTTGWMLKTIPSGSKCIISFDWTSTADGSETGDGMVKVLRNNTAIVAMNVSQGSVSIDLSPYLRNGANKLSVRVTDVYNNTKSLVFNVNVVNLSISSNFDSDQYFNNVISYTYVPVGNTEKTVHFKLDGRELSTDIVTDSGRQCTKSIPRQSHGSHTLEVWFTSVIEGSTVESNHLFYDLICLEAGNETPIISCDFALKEVDQYSTVVIPYKVYSPMSLTSEVYLNDSKVTVDRTKQQWSYRANTKGDVILTIRCGSVTKTVRFTVNEVKVDVSAVTANQALHLTSYGRSNNEDNPAVWKSGSIGCTFSGFSWINDGWVLDEDGATVLRIPSGGKVEIPYKLFQNDFRSTGKTVEFEITTRNVSSINPVIYCGDRLTITPNKAELRSEQASISMTYKDEEHLRISFVVEKRTENRLVYLYIDGVMSGAIQYPTIDNFAVNSPTNIFLDANGCVLDIYNIRIYDNNLTKEQILDNWIADTQDGETLIRRYSHNAVFDAYSQIVIDQLPKDLPYLVLEAPQLPQYKGDKKTVSGRFVDPMDSSRCWSFEDAKFDVQGTSSQYYSRKNYKGKYSRFVTDAGRFLDKFSIRNDGIGVNVFCYKADVASSEGANNVELVRLYHDICPSKTPAMAANNKVRWGIDGFPIVVFWSHDNTTTFLGKYNFNYDKGTPEVFGFKAGDESWEILNNTSDRVTWHNDDFTSDSWQKDFESRYPEDYTDSTKLSALAAWIKSTDGNLDKFKSEFDTWFDRDSTIFYYLFTEIFLMVDSRAKNAFPTYIADWGKWTIFPYDFDTALGINNEGGILEGNSYNLQDTDHLDSGADVFNGQKSVLWNNLREAFSDEIKSMYKSLRSSGELSYEKVDKRFTDHQSKWCEAIVNEDAQYKYIDPLLDEGNSSYLSMLQGLKTSQRKWWLYNRFRYMDSRYNAGDDLTDTITLRGYAKDNITLTPQSDMYCNIKYGSYLVSQRCTGGQSYTLECPLANVNDTEIYIYSASRIASLGDISGLKVGYADFSRAVKLENLKIGDGTSTYSNGNLTELNIATCTMLKTLDVQNCPNLSGTVIMSSCDNIESIDLRGTSVAAVELPKAGVLKTLRLPGTITSLVILNHPYIETLDVASYSNITTLRLEGLGDVVNVLDVLNKVNSGTRVRLAGFDLTVSNTDQIRTFYSKLDEMTGLDELGNNSETAQVSGTIRIPNILGSEMAEFMDQYPYITILPDHISCTVKYYTWDGATLLHTETVVDGADATYSGRPNRPNTPQYTFTFAGWARDLNGVVWTDAQKKVTSDRNLYAAYTAEGQKYTVRFYNGSTLLQTVNNVLYGGSAYYSGDTSILVDPEGSGMPFDSWVPRPTNITGNTSCYASYKPPVEVAEIADDWSTIIGYVNDGTYMDHYKIGNYKPLDLGTEGTVNMQIVAFDTDTKADGSGTAPISWLSKELLKTSKRWNPPIKYVYDYRTTKGWPEGTGTLTGNSIQWESKNAYTDNVHAIGTMVLTATESGDIKIEASCYNSGLDKLTVTVDGLELCSNYTGTSYVNKAIAASEGQIIIINADYLNTSTTSRNYGRIRITGKFTYSRTSEDSMERYEKAYVDSTGTVGGWEKSELRSYYKETLKPLIPSYVQNSIVSVSKSQTGYKTDKSSETQVSIEDVWCPSYPEMFNSRSNGGLYHTLFSDSSSRKKMKVGSTSTSNWWLRSAGGAQYAYYVRSSGGSNYGNAGASCALALGFCF